MSTTADPSSRLQASRARVSSLASSRAFGTFAVVFAISFSVIYVVSELARMPLFTYHPGTNRIDFGLAAARPNEGPVMYWYGWLATSFIGASLLGILSTLLPERVTGRIPLFLVWLLPLAAIPILAYALMPFWTR
jgi:hypothetical protein